MSPSLLSQSLLARQGVINNAVKIISGARMASSGHRIERDTFGNKLAIFQAL